jgi:hypothetical protein
MTSVKRTPLWRWTALLGATSLLVFGLVLAVVSGGPGWPLVPMVAVLLVAIAGGAVARRWVDIAALGVGLAIAIEAQAIITALQPGAPSDLPLLMLSVAGISGVLLTILGSIAFFLGPRFDGPAFDSLSRTLKAPRLGCLGRLAAGLVVAFAAGWMYANVSGQPVSLDSYRVVGERDIAVTVASGKLTWCRPTKVAETVTEVTLEVVCTSFQLGPGTADAVPTEVAIHLDQPLGDRTVRDSDGRAVQRIPPPSHAIDQTRAMAIAEGVLEAEHPGIAIGNTKIMDITLDKDPSGRAAWKVNIIVVDTSLDSPAYPSSIWMWIDAESGTVTIISKT